MSDTNAKRNDDIRELLEETAFEHELPREWVESSLRALESLQESAKTLAEFREKLGEETYEALIAKFQREREARSGGENE